MYKKILTAIFLFAAYIFPQSDSTLILSEVMFNPQSGPNEFIELYNTSETESIDLNGYKTKYSTSNPDIITDAGEGTLLPPKSFAIILEGVDAIENVRKLVGSTESKSALPGTIRGDFTHVSYSHANQKRIA